ncbi:MAG: VanZ family protein [Oscillospiraceae bacterium]|nr:VanZ family protein [Oscillospiraceae bacterium]
MFSFGNVLLFCVLCAPVYVLPRWLYCRKKRPGNGFGGELLRFVFVMYLVALLSMTVVPDWSFTQYEGEGLGIEIYWRMGTINLVPFRTIAMYLRGHPSAVVNLLGNVAVFVPLGFLPPLIWQKWRPFRNILMLSVAFPLFIEFEQHFIGRASDIDDLMLNAIGILFGYAMWLLANKPRVRKGETP